MRTLITVPRTVTGYHGCPQATADAILTQGDFRPSENRYDWLGRGIYFCEYAPYRALQWATLVSLETGDAPAVLAATIRLGECVNLMDVERHDELVATHKYLKAAMGDAMPKNTDKGGHF